MTRPGSRRHWTTFAYLGYLVFFLIGPIWYGGSWPLTWLALALFLPVYFWTYGVEGPRALWGIAAITLLGMAYAPINMGASTFFVYAGAMAANLGRPRRAWGVLVAVMAAVVVTTLTLQPLPFFWIPAVFCTALVGSCVIYYRELGRTYERLRLSREEVSRLARIAERERIARDLHDLLGHTLSVITLKSSLAAKLAEREPERASEEMREVERISRQALKEVRGAVVGYRAATLAGEVENARSALAAAGVELECASQPPELAPLEEGVLALALREAVTNVIRHAGARSCRIEIARNDGGVRLEVEDDGAGTEAPEGAGLAGMRERVASLGGRVERLAGRRQAERGTRLVVSLPVAAAGLQTAGASA